ncbi:unnamed protein product, partial [Urochloa humidicola]
SLPAHSNPARESRWSSPLLSSSRPAIPPPLFTSLSPLASPASSLSPTEARVLPAAAAIQLSFPFYALATTRSPVGVREGAVQGRRGEKACGSHRGPRIRRRTSAARTSNTQIEHKRPWLSPTRCEAPPLFLRRHRGRLRMRRPTGTSPPLVTKAAPGPPHYPGLRLPLSHLRAESLSPAAAFHSLLLASEAESSAARSPGVSGDRLPQSPRAPPVGC